MVTRKKDKWRLANAAMQSVTGLVAASAVLAVLAILAQAVELLPDILDELQAKAPWMAWYWNLFGLHIVALMVITATWTVEPVIRVLNTWWQGRHTDSKKQ